MAGLASIFLVCGLLCDGGLSRFRRGGAVTPAQSPPTPPHLACCCPATPSHWRFPRYARVRSSLALASSKLVFWKIVVLKETVASISVPNASSKDDGDQPDCGRRSNLRNKLSPCSYPRTGKEIDWSFHWCLLTREKRAASPERRFCKPAASCRAGGFNNGLPSLLPCLLPSLHPLALPLRANGLPGLAVFPRRHPRHCCPRFPRF
jgi:hypothetical protein